MTIQLKSNKQDLVWLEPQTPIQIIEDLIENHNKTKFHVLLSGGQDSISVVDYIVKNYPDNFENCVFTNTGIASQMTRKFVLEYCKEKKWSVEMTWGGINKTYYEIVMEHGFPSAGSHRIVMGCLKFHAWYHYLKTKKETHCFISGVRKKESWVRDKKSFYTKTPIDVNADITFAKPFLYKNGQQLQEYFITNGLKKSPAYYYFDKSGECWCGCFTNEWERKMIQKYDPFLFETISWLEEQVQLYGTKEARKYPYWGRYGNPIYETNFQQILDLDIELKTNEDYCGESCESDNMGNK